MWSETGYGNGEKFRQSFPLRSTLSEKRGEQNVTGKMMVPELL